MDFGGPASAAFTNGLRAVFFKAPLPSGWTLIDVLSRESASMETVIICSACILSNTRCSTPDLLQRFIRV